MNKLIHFLFAALAVVLNIDAFSQGRPLGIFEGHAIIGAVSHPGTALYDTATRRYQLGGNQASANGNDLNFLWKRLKGDFILYTRVEFTGGMHAEGKLGWMVRNSMDENSPQINAAVNGNGLAAMQLKRKAGDTAEIRCKVTHADVIQLEREGNTYTMRVARFGEPFTMEQVTDTTLGDEVYVGLFINAHSKSATENAIYRDVSINVPVDDNLKLIRTDVGSNLEILDIQTGSREIIYTDSNAMHAPIWTRDGKSLIYSRQGLMYTYDLATHERQVINTEKANRNNNDHVLSCDGKTLAFSNTEREFGGALIYTVPVTGGTPKKITPKGSV